MTATSNANTAWGMVRTMADRLRGPIGGESAAGPFVERSRNFYSSSRCWLYTSGAVVVTGISVLQGWPAGFMVAALTALTGVHSFFRREHSGSVTRYLMMDVTVMGVAMVVIGIPTVAAVLAIIMTFYSGLLLERGLAVLVSTYMLAWATVAYVVSILRAEPTVAATDPTLWIVSITVFAVVLVLIVARRMVESISELENLRVRFLGGVAHDLRNPLTAVIGAAAVLHEAGADLTDAETAEMIDIILGQAAEANRMVGDLLASACLDASNLDLETQTIDLTQLIEETVVVMSTAGAGGDVEFVSLDRPILVCADPMRIRQVIQNLVSNAVRYGGDHVQVRIESREETVAVQVRDNGPGITEDERESVFAPFTRASGAKRQEEAAVGLGLSVARQLARLMGGDLTYDHVDGESVFELTIPPGQSLSPETAPRVDVVTTELAEVWLDDDGVLRVSYHPRKGIENREHATAVVEAVGTCADGEKRPLMVITHGIHPDRDARKLYVETVPATATAVAVVATGAPIPTGIANLFVSQMRLTIPIRVFDSETEALGWLKDHPSTRIDSAAQRLAPIAHAQNYSDPSS